MLKQQLTHIETDPLADFLQTGVEDIVIYSKEINQNYKSRAQKNKERIQKLTKYITDPQLKRQRRLQAKLAEKAKLHKTLDNMTKEQARTYLDAIKKQKNSLKQKVRQAMKDGQIIMLDLVYEQKMNGKENKSLCKQIELIMRTIKHTHAPPSIHLCSLKGNLQKHLEKMRYQFWALTPHQQDIHQIASRLGKKLIYLSPDAEQQLQSVDKDTAYILGGLIDRTILKNASLNRAKQLNIETRKLPISQFMKGRLCLNLDHVVSMVCKFSETGSWKEAFQYAAPKRWKKELQNKGQSKEESDFEQEEKEQEKNQRIDKEQSEKDSQENSGNYIPSKQLPGDSNL